MKFVAFGDSFTLGHVAGRPHEKSKEISFVNQLANYTDKFTDYVNYAEAGASNTQIAYKVYNWAKSESVKDCFVFIGWTTFIRNSKWELDEYRRFGANNKFNLFRKFKIDKVFLPDSVKRQIFDTERDILATSKMLDQLGVPYCMIQAFDDHTLINECLINKSIPFPNWINWGMKNNTIIDMCYERYLSDVNHADFGKNHKEFEFLSKYLTECRHPNEDGHQLIAKILANNIVLNLTK